MGNNKHIDKKNIVDVSVVSANYNFSKYLPEYITGILNSTVQPREIIIVDDGSTDQSLKALSEYKNIDYMNVIPLKKNTGLANALNTGIEKANAKYIMRLDTDDCIDKKRIEVQYNFLENNPDISIVGSNTSYFKKDVKISISKSNFPVEPDKIKNRYMEGEHGLAHTSVMGLRSLFLKYKYIQENVKAEDYDIFARMINDGIKFYNLKEPLTYYRIHSGNSANMDLYDTIKKTYNLRDHIFNKKTSGLKILLNYIHIYYYRKYLYHYKKPVSYLYLMISGLFRPDKILSRLNM